MARSGRETRSAYAYVIHGRGRRGPIDYEDFFRRLAAVPALSRQIGVGDEVVALTAAVGLGDGSWALRFVAGLSGAPPLFYDPATGEETYGSTSAGFVARASWAVVSPRTRIAITERRRPGVAPSLMARALSHLGRQLNLEEQLSMEWLPIVSESFLDELERYERIRRAAVTVSRPNYNWADSATELTNYADESNADDVELQLSARRGESLEKQKGIISDIRAMVRNRFSPLKNLKIVGRRSGEQRETALSLNRYQERAFFDVPSDADPATERDAFISRSLDLVGDLQEQQDDG